MNKYLYGASVQGIQEFIFKTNKLQEIVGASEIVEKICREWFFDVAGIDKSDSNLVLSAAGNIKFFFQTKEECEIVVKSFPKHVMEKAPGITISQAVVKVETDSYSYQNIKSLEAKLKTKRSKPKIPLEQGYMSLERARRTGGVVTVTDFTNYEDDTKDRLKKLDNPDFATIQKIVFQDNKELFYKLSGLQDINNSQLPLDLKEMTKSGSNSWIAVIHADGNGLGKILHHYGEKLIENKEYKTFSNGIQTATETACQMAFEKVIKYKYAEFKKFPIRPIIIGGDDVTIIIRADLALCFTHEFLKAFEEASINAFKILKTNELHSGLTACAGICFVKDTYPLHYALKLSEDLCKDAKKMVKKDISTWKNQNYLPQSSVAIFKVMDSFVEDLESMKIRTMQADGNLDFYSGPYWISKTNYSPNVDELIGGMEVLKSEVDQKNKDKKDSRGVSKLRQLISESFENFENMKIMKDRMKEINVDLYNKLKLDETLMENGKSIIYDLINLHGFKY